MYAAVLELKSWMGKRTYFFEGETPTDIIFKFQQEQNLECLVRMGSMEEDKKGLKEINKINAFLKKYYSGKLKMKDIKEFSFNLSVGSCRCIDVAEGDEAIVALKAAHPEAR